MDKVITQGSTIQCVHQGTITPVDSAVSKVLTVNGEPVLVGDLVGSLVGSDCIQKPPPSTNVPCAKVSSRTSGASTVLTADDSAVLLFNSAGATGGAAGSPSPTNGWKVNDAGQTFFTAD